MTFLSLILTIVCSLVIGLIAYYLGYTTGSEREHNRLCEQWMKERREDGK